MKRTLLTIPLLLFLVACASLYTGVVTMTSVVDAAMKDWASLSVAGKTSAAIDARVKATHDQYRQAAAATQVALITYKQSGDQGPYIAALNSARVIAQQLIDLIVPLVTTSEGNALKTNLAKASHV